MPKAPSLQRPGLLLSLKVTVILLGACVLPSLVLRLLPAGWFSQGHGMDHSRRISGLHQAASAMLAYAERNDDRLPPAAGWMTAAAGCSPNGAEGFMGDAEVAGSCVAMNGAAGAIEAARVAEPDRAVMAFCGSERRLNLHGGPSLLWQPPEGQRTAAAAIDGHAFAFRPGAPLDWHPDQALLSPEAAAKRHAETGAKTVRKI